MRLLFVDPFSGFGHRSLDAVYIRRFVDLGYTVDVATKEGYLRELDIRRAVAEVPLPRRYFPGRPGRFRHRLAQVRLLRYVRRHMRRERYDLIFFSYFDELPLLLSGIRGNLILMSHANVAGLEHPIKRMLLRRAAKRGRLLVFHEFIRQRCVEHGIANVTVEPLGLSEPYLMSHSERARICTEIEPRLGKEGEFAHVVFAPSGAKFADGFLGMLANDPAFTSFLEKHRIGLVLKDVGEASRSRNVVVIRRHLSDEEYRALFLASSAIVLSYPPSFHLRVSAALFECFANGKPCLVSDIQAFRVFEEYFTYDPFFSGRAELTEALERLCVTDGKIRASPYQHLERLNPRLENL